MISTRRKILISTQVGNKDMFGAAFSEAPDVAPALTGQEDAEELAQRARAAAALHFCQTRRPVWKSKFATRSS